MGSKIGKHLQLVGGRIIVQQEKMSKSRTRLDEPVECVLGGDPLLLYKIPHLLFFDTNTLCTTP